MSVDTLFAADGPDEAFLEYIDDRFRGSFKNYSLTLGPRAGVVEPSAIEAEVRRVLSRRSDPGALGMIAAMDQHPTELKAFLVAIREHDAQPEHIRLQRKQRGRLEGIARNMPSARPTQRQLRLLNGLGYTGDVQTSLQAHKTIEHLLSQAHRRANRDGVQ